MGSFVRPVFHDRCVELRCTADEVCIYATRDGMRKLAELCLQLAEVPTGTKTDHLHLDDYDILTAKSLHGTIAVFDN